MYQNLVFVFEGEREERIINESLIEDNFCEWFPFDYSNFIKNILKEIVLLDINIINIFLLLIF